MPGRTSKYNEQANINIRVGILDALNEATEYDVPTTDWIKAHSISLATVTPQKLSRVLNELWELGIVQKGKSKSLNRMIYRLTAQMRIDGYEV